MTSHDPIEARLRGAFAFEPSADGLAWLDGRVAEVIAQGGSAARSRRPSLRTFLRPLPLLAAFLLLAATAIGGAALIERLVDSSGVPGWRTGWDQAQVVGTSRTIEGVTVTLERAYADRNRVLVGFTVEGIGAQGGASGAGVAPLEWVAHIRDPQGSSAEQWATSQAAIGADETQASAVIHTWEGAVAPVAGTWQLTISSLGQGAGGGGGFAPGACTVGATDPECQGRASAVVEGPWTFDFELPAPAGTIVSNPVSDTRGSATLTLTELRITPTAVSTRIALRVDGAVVHGWTPGNHALVVRHDDASYTSNASTRITTDTSEQGPHGDENEFMAIAGSDDPSGTWVIEITDVEYASGAGVGNMRRLSGPWTLSVDVP